MPAELGDKIHVWAGGMVHSASLISRHADGSVTVKLDKPLRGKDTFRAEAITVYRRIDVKSELRPNGSVQAVSDERDGNEQKTT